MILDNDALNLLEQVIQSISDNSEEARIREEGDEGLRTAIKPHFVELELIKDLLMPRRSERLKSDVIRWIAYMWPESTGEALRSLPASARTTDA